jgi:integrase
VPGGSSWSTPQSATTKTALVWRCSTTCRGPGARHRPQDHAVGADVAVDTALAKALKRAKAFQAAERLRLGSHYVGGEDHVVVDAVGRPYHRNTLSDFWRALCRAAGVKQIRLHDVRHSCASIVHAQAVPIAVISAWLGHADPAFT